MAELQGALKSNYRARSARLFLIIIIFLSIGKEQRDQLEKT